MEATRADAPRRHRVGEALKRLVDRGRDAVQPAEQDDLAVQVVGLDRAGAAREALPRRAAAARPAVDGLHCSRSPRRGRSSSARREVDAGGARARPRLSARAARTSALRRAAGCRTAASTRVAEVHEQLGYFQRMMSGAACALKPDASKAAATASVRSRRRRAGSGRRRGCRSSGAELACTTPGSRWVAGSITHIAVDVGEPAQRRGARSRRRSARRRSASSGGAAAASASERLGRVLALHREQRPRRRAPGRSDGADRSGSASVDRAVGRLEHAARSCAIARRARRGRSARRRGRARTAAADHAADRAGAVDHEPHRRSIALATAEAVVSASRRAVAGPTASASAVRSTGQSFSRNSRENC